jgi:hypothetical protein
MLRNTHEHLEIKMWGVCIAFAKRVDESSRGWKHTHKIKVDRVVYKIILAWFDIRWRGKIYTI